MSRHPPTVGDFHRSEFESKKRSSDKERPL